MTRFLFICFVSGFFYACQSDQPVPKPPTYLRTELPDHAYRQVSNDCPYELKLAEIYNYKPCVFEKSNFYKKSELNDVFVKELIDGNVLNMFSIIEEKVHNERFVRKLKRLASIILN